jgi:hypothetical protein
MVDGVLVLFKTIQLSYKIYDFFRLSFLVTELDSPEFRVPELVDRSKSRSKYFWSLSQQKC